MAQWRGELTGVAVGEPTSAQSNDLEGLADRLRASDLFVFRRIADDRFVHLGGVGRGVGWAGLIDVHLRDEPLLARAVAATTPVRLESRFPRKVVGPYYARSAVAIPLLPDTVVVVGTPRGAVAALNDEEMRAAGAAAAQQVDEVSPSKRLADELEVMHALRELDGADFDHLSDALGHVAECAARALSCELGLLYWIETDQLATTTLGWWLPGTADQRRTAMRELALRRDPFPVCAQDLSTGSPLGQPFGPDAGCRSAYLLDIDDPRAGLLVLIHTDASPRGFTTLCQELGAKLAAAAGPLLHEAATRQRLRTEIDEAYRLARQDALTGLANRRAWDEAVAATQARMPASGPASMVLADVVGLKRINDTLGLSAGDDVIRTAAEALSGAVRDRDVLARIGGDEFALLLPGTGEDECHAVVERIGPLVADAAGEATGLPLSFSLGWSTAAPDGELKHALEAADIMLCEAKRARRAR